MNWLLYAATAIIVLLSIMQIFADFFLKHVFKDARKNEHKKLRNWLLGVTLALVIVSQALAVITNLRGEAKAESERKAFNSQIITVSSNQIKLQQTQSEFGQELKGLSMAIATNAAIDPGTRQAIVRAQSKAEELNSEVVDIKNWVDLLQKKRISVKNEREGEKLERSRRTKDILEKCRPYYFYAAKTLEQLLIEIARQKGEKISSDLNDFPSEVSEADVRVADITVGTNTVWSFSVLLANIEGASAASPPWLKILTKDGSASLSFEALPVNNMFYSYLQLPNEARLTEVVELDKSKSKIDESLKLLIASQAERVMNTNR